MNRLDLILFILLSTISVFKTFGTAQVPDRLVYKGDTLSIFANPLELLYSDDSQRPKFFGDKEGCNSTACWRGYQAEWVIIDGQLYLTGIFSCCFYDDKIKADLTALFGSKFVDGKVKADWVTGNIIAPQGKQLYYVHMGYESLYEKELEFQFRNGGLIGTKTYDNSKSRQSNYSKDPEKLKEFIYSHINWTRLPKSKEPVKVFIQFSANENGIVDSTKVMNGYDATFDREAERVVKAIPEWDVYYRHEKLERRKWTMPIIFSEDNRKKYQK
ncbi:hypothetical protein [Pseudochryseolinea flava]|uniref:hypothetical protein n=1 Tax=Pseudochryseolinea flava TaxID=2059302 RepID=UPI0010577CD0|nr:hypothetical protein [Pseudochryseolinea flava]